jgi:hypothetical protein
MFLLAGGKIAMPTILNHAFEQVSFLPSMVRPMWQSPSKAETYLRKAKEQASQYDIVQSLIQAVDELSREIARVESEMRRVRREAQRRRF